MKKKKRVKIFPVIGKYHDDIEHRLQEYLDQGWKIITSTASFIVLEMDEEDQQQLLD